MRKGKRFYRWPFPKCQMPLFREFSSYSQRECAGCREMFKSETTLSTIRDAVRWLLTHDCDGSWIKPK